MMMMMMEILTFFVIVAAVWLFRHHRHVVLRLVESHMDAMTLMVLLVPEEIKRGDGCGMVVLNLMECVVCLGLVSPGQDGSGRLPNCSHGDEFHAECMDAWLEDHSSCPLCRSHVPGPLLRRLKNAYCLYIQDALLSYFNSALENVAASISGECHVPAVSNYSIAR